MLFHFYNPTFTYNHPCNFHQKFVPLLKSIFTSLFHHYLFTKSSLQSPLTYSLPLYLSNFLSPYFCVQPSQQFKSNLGKQKSFNASVIQSIQDVREEPRELGSRVWTDTVLISPFFLKVSTGMTGLTGLTIIDALSLRLRKLVYCRTQSLMKMLAIKMANHLILLLSYVNLLSFLPYPTIPSQELTFPWKQAAKLDFNPKFSKVIYYSCCTFPPICLEIIPSYHRIQSPIKLGNNTLPSHFEIRPQQQS